MALRQRDLLRLMAWSTIAQAGWVLLPVWSVSAGSLHASAQYLALYTLGTLAVFAVLAAFERPGHPLTIDGLCGMFRSHPLSAATMALGLLALAGLPPSIVGVVAKIVAMKPVAVDHAWWLLGFAVVNALLGVAVYLRWILAMRSTQEAGAADVAGPDGGADVTAGTVDGVAVGRAVAPSGAFALPRARGAAASEPGDARLGRVAALPAASRGSRAVVALLGLALVVTSVLPSLILRFF